METVEEAPRPRPGAKEVSISRWTILYLVRSRVQVGQRHKREVVLYSVDDGRHAHLEAVPRVGDDIVPHIFAHPQDAAMLLDQQEQADEKLGDLSEEDGGGGGVQRPRLGAGVTDE